MSRRLSLASLVLAAILFTPAIGSAALIGSLNIGGTNYTLGPDFLPLVYSPLTPVGGMTAPFIPVDLVLPPTPTPTSTSGCEVTDFSAVNTVGKFALVMDGGCDYDTKNQNAAAAGAIGMIVFGQGQPGNTDVITASFSGPGVALIPTIYLDFAIASNLDLGRLGNVVTMDVRDSSLPTSDVPEPATLALVLAGCLGVARRVRCKA